MFQGSNSLFSDTGDKTHISDFCLFGANTIKGWLDRRKMCHLSEIWIFKDELYLCVQGKQYMNIDLQLHEIQSAL